jgi:hypothetical protein
VERDDAWRSETQLRRSDAFQRASAVGRFMLALEHAIGGDAPLLDWTRRHHALVLVNHAPHVAFAKRRFGPDYVLETHDVLSEQLNSHGVPHFATRAFDRRAKRTTEERTIWAEAEACITLSPSDHAVIAPHARRSKLIRPYIRPTMRRLRPWDEVCAANALSARFQKQTAFDLLLWGDWHRTNVEGVRWFLKKVMPLNPRLANATVLIAGRVIRGLPQRLLHRPNIYAAGFVDHLEDLFARTRVLIVPDRQGSGISIKAMEACAHGAPFVSTCAGMRGVDLDGIQFEPAANAAAFARDVAILLTSRGARADRAKIARGIYEKNFSEHAYEQGWDELIAEVRPNLMTAHASMRTPHSTPQPTPQPTPSSAPAITALEAAHATASEPLRSVTRAKP